MTLPIILLKGQSQYGALRLHVDQLAQALRNRGQQTVIFDHSHHTMEHLVTALNAGCRAVISFNGIGLDLQVDDQPFYDAVGVPLATVIVDHPAHHHQRLQGAGQRVAVNVIDRSHLDWLTDVFGRDRFLLTGLLPPGGNIEEAPADRSVEAFIRQRDINLLFTGTYRGLPERPWAAFNSPFVRGILDLAADMCLAEDMMPVEQAMTQALESKDVQLSGGTKPRFWLLASALTDYIHALRRHQALCAVGESGLPLSLYGRSWDPFLEAYPHVAYGGEGNFEETLHLLKRTRICLNTNTNFVAGAHERVFAAQRAGAAVCTDASRYYEAAYEDGSDILLYRWTSLDEMPAMLATHLDDPERLAKVGLAGRAKADAEHSWEVRADTLLGQIDLYYGFGRCA